MTYLEEIGEAVGRVDHLRFRQADPSSPILESPGCEKACPRCPRSCAINQIMLRWWENELGERVGTFDFTVWQ